MAGEKFFTELFKGLSGKDLEEYHKTVFLNMDSEFALEKRYEYYKAKLKYMGKDVKIGPGVRLVNPENISLGDRVQIAAHCTLVAASKEGISMDEGSKLMYGVYLDTETPDKGYIKIGKRVYIGTGTCLHGHSGLEIGEDSLLAQNITITPYSHIFKDPEKIIYAQGGHTNKITLGRDCYLGMSVSVLFSAGSIGEGSVIGAGSVVVKPVPPYSIAVGVPAKVIKKRGNR